MAHEPSDDELLRRAAKQGDIPTARRLVSREVDVNVTHDKGLTALWWASDRGHLDMVLLLLDHGANPDIADPLIQAAHKGHTDICAQLIASGADPLRKDITGQTALDAARARGHIESAECIEGLMTRSQIAAIGPSTYPVDVSDEVPSTSALEHAAAMERLNMEIMRVDLESEKRMLSARKAEAERERDDALKGIEQAKQEAHRMIEQARNKARMAKKQYDALQKKHSLPEHWEKQIASRSQDGFAAISLDRRRDHATWATLESLLQTDPDKLKRSGSDRSGTTHDRLKLACAWRLEHPVMWEQYMSGVQRVMRDRKLLERADVRAVGGLPVATARAARELPGQIRTEVNEAILMHGTNPGVMLSVLSTGPNERFSGSNAGTAYGDGTYLAEDAGKNDQYVTVDEQHDATSELHKRLYGHGTHHPGNVYYLLVCRVALGHHVRTQRSGTSATSADDGKSIFPVSFRELAAVPSVTPPVHYHSLLADVISVGARYREVVVFHSEFIYPEYVLAYQRFDGMRGPL